MSGLSVYLKSDFADIWEAFTSPPEGYVAEDFLDDILAFFLEYCGIRILPPTAEHFQPKDCLMVMTPEEKDMAKKMATMPESPCFVLCSSSATVYLSSAHRTPQQPP